MQGLLDFIKTPEGQGLLSGVFGYAANARRGQPINNIGRGGVAGLLGYANAMDRQDQQAENQWAQKYRQMQMDKAQYDMDRTRSADAEKSRIESVIRSALGPVSGTQAIGVDAAGPTASKAALIGQMPKLDPNALIAQGVPVDRVKELIDAQNFGKPKVARTVKGMGPDGREYEYQVDEFGQRVGDGLAQYRAPIQSDLGGRQVFLDPYKLNQVAGFDKTMTPEGRDASARGWATVGQAERRLAFDQQGGTEGGVQQAGLVRQFGKPPAGYRWKPDGNLEVIPGGPTDQKSQAQDAGRETVSKVISDLGNYYNTLDKEGAITSTGNRAGTNLGAWLSTTGVGQKVGGAFGTKSQSARDSIEQTRPLLMQAIMKATGMSAKQMDSNAELKMYLATATDPTKSLEANREALQRLEELYGLGGGAGQRGASGSWAAAGKQVKRTGTYNGRKVIEYTDGTVTYGN